MVKRENKIATHRMRKGRYNARCGEVEVVEKEGPKLATG